MKINMGISNLSVLFPDGVDYKIPNIPPWTISMEELKAEKGTRRVFLPGTDPLRYIDIAITPGEVEQAVGLSKDDGLACTMVQTINFETEACDAKTKEKGPKVKVK